MNQPEFDPDVPATSREQEQYDAIEIQEEVDTTDTTALLPHVVIRLENNLETPEAGKERVFQVFLLLIYAGECTRTMLNIYIFLTLLNVQDSRYSTFTEGVDLGLCVLGLFPLAYSLTDHPHRWATLIAFGAISQVTPLALNGCHWNTFLNFIAEFSGHAEKTQKFVYVLMYAVVILLYVYYVVGLLLTISYLAFMYWKWRNRCENMRFLTNMDN